MLIAVLDLTVGYPEGDDAFISWFMVDGERQRIGIGSQIFADIRAAMKAQGYDYLSLRCNKEYKDAIAFWTAQGFSSTGEEYTKDGYTICTYSRSI
ncbi:MAG: GNAT family N-acetyltransferase [Lachnospiraceae bacterium]|nr:GNAT family N-acetyltransferase [Lachnospiraceae bacterium]